jgi:hypothetical protein
MIADAEHAKIMSLESKLPVSVGCVPFDCRLPLSSWTSSGEREWAVRWCLVESNRCCTATST